jgi:hypothetical protein
MYKRQGDSQQPRLFPDDDQVPVPDDPDVVRIRLGSVGWTNSRRFGDVWLALQLWKLLGLDEIVNRHVPQGKESVRQADIVAIEVINRLCGPCSEFALAEHWYASTGLDCQTAQNLRAAMCEFDPLVIDAPRKHTDERHNRSVARAPQ